MAWSPFFPGFPANPKDQSEKTPLQILKFVEFFLRKVSFIVLEWHELVMSKLQKFQVNYCSAQSISSRGKPGTSASSKAVVACDVSVMGGNFFP